MRAKRLLLAPVLLAATVSLAAEPQEVKRLDGSMVKPAEMDETAMRLMKAAEVPGMGLALFSAGRFTADDSSRFCGISAGRHGKPGPVQKRREEMLGPQIQILSKHEFPTLDDFRSALSYRVAHDGHHADAAEEQSDSNGSPSSEFANPRKFNG